jgi:hypothetical protein
MLRAILILMHAGMEAVPRKIFVSSVRHVLKPKISDFIAQAAAAIKEGA